jgi:hypothetical protein
MMGGFRGRYCTSNDADNCGIIAAKSSRQGTKMTSKIFVLASKFLAAHTLLAQSIHTDKDFQKISK